MADGADFLLGALTVNPLFIFLAAAPFHIADTGARNLFLTFTFRTDFFVLGHDHTSSTVDSSDSTAVYNNKIRMKWRRSRAEIIIA